MGGRQFGDALLAEGFQLPHGCRNVRILSSVESALLIQFDCLVYVADLEIIGRALLRLAETMKAP